MKSIKLLAAVAAFGLVATPAMAQMTSTMGNSISAKGSASMMKGPMDKPLMDRGMMDKGISSKGHMMPMQHVAMSKKTMARCHTMSHSRMTHNHQSGALTGTCASLISRAASSRACPETTP